MICNNLGPQISPTTSGNNGHLAGYSHCNKNNYRSKHTSGQCKRNQQKTPLVQHGTIGSSLFRRFITSILSRLHDTPKTKQIFTQRAHLLSRQHNFETHAHKITQQLQFFAVTANSTNTSSHGKKDKTTTQKLSTHTFLKNTRTFQNAHQIYKLQERQPSSTLSTSTARMIKITSIKHCSLLHRLPTNR